MSLDRLTCLLDEGVISRCCVSWLLLDEYVDVYALIGACL